MLEHGVHRMKQLDGNNDQCLLGRFALGLIGRIAVGMARQGYDLQLTR